MSKKRNNQRVVNGILWPKETCEYAIKCQLSCEGKNPNRNHNFGCGLRRGFLISEGYQIIGG